ncbi:probable E3 ubiquitin-protein ligase TRIML2 [Sardina pilchardus]|uniref:probable E3 ubiquitin-protein ligase TRIML2 n=1 Tax=Sardina pilchardus TaxID=27697 RepID=UPI002E12E161
MSSSTRSVAPVKSAISLCGSHHRLTVFCQACGVALCDSCLSNGSHCHHQFSSLQDACKKRIDELKGLAGNIRGPNSFTYEASITNRTKLKEDIFLKIKENLDAMFKELRDLVEVSKNQAFKLLAAQQKNTEAQFKIMEAQFKIKTMAEIHEKLEQLWIEAGQSPDNVSSVMTQCVEVEKRIEIIDKNSVDWEKDDHLRLKSLENSVQKILEMSKSCLTQPWEFADFITFDKNTAHEKLRVSEDHRQVTVFAKDLRSNHRSNEVQDAVLLHVQAEQAFTTGQHYWEVDVRGCRSWEIGVLGEEGTEKLSWTLRLDDGMLSALHDRDDVRVREQDLSFLGVFLDCDKGRLWFYNVAVNAVMHAFAVRCGGGGRPMRPVFSIAPKDDDFSRLVLWNICEKDPRPESPASMADPCVDSPSATGLQGPLT